MKRSRRKATTRPNKQVKKKFEPVANNLEVMREEAFKHINFVNSVFPMSVAIDIVIEDDSLVITFSRGKETRTFKRTMSAASDGFLLGVHLVEAVCSTPSIEKAIEFLNRSGETHKKLTTQQKEDIRAERLELSQIKKRHLKDHAE